jgi:hypothetical protein
MKNPPVRASNSLERILHACLSKRDFGTRALTDKRARRKIDAALTGDFGA